MNVKDKLKLFADHGMSISYIARRINVASSTLNKWLNGEKGITHKNEALVENTLKEILLELSQILEEKKE